MKRKGRKIKRNKEKWKVIKRKKLRNHGQEYVDRKGKIHAKKVFKPKLPNKICHGRDCANISVSESKLLFDQFWELGDFNIQNTYIAGCVIQCYPEHKRQCTAKKSENQQHDADINS